MRKTNKKAQAANGAVGAIITLIVGVGVSVMVLIFMGALGGQTYNLVQDDITGISNNVVTGEALVVDNVTTAEMAHSFIQAGTLTISNGSATGNTMALSNYTVDYDNGKVTLVTPNGQYLGLVNQTQYLNYTWGSAQVRESVEGGIISGFEALEQTGDYLPIIVLAVVISLVLFLVLGFTAFGGRKNDGMVL